MALVFKEHGHNLVSLHSGLGIELRTISDGKSRANDHQGVRLIRYQTISPALLPPSALQTIQPRVIVNFKPKANHKLLAMVATLDNPPAVIAPKNNARKAPIRLFLLAFLFASRSGSTSRSHNKVVSTTVGISSYARILDAQICPPA